MATWGETQQRSKMFRQSNIAPVRSLSTLVKFSPVPKIQATRGAARSNRQAACVTTYPLWGLGDGGSAVGGRGRRG
eukprot:15443081-Alexandrium_andersonii.AAC.1